MLFPSLSDSIIPQWSSGVKRFFKFFWWPPSPNLFQLHQLTHHHEGFVPTYFATTIFRCAPCGLLGWRCSSCINGSFFNGLTTSPCEDLLPTDLTAWSGLLPRGFFWLFLVSLSVFIIPRIIGYVKGFLNFFWLFFPFGGKVATLTNFYSLSYIAARHTYFFTRLSEIPWYFILERTFWLRPLYFTYLL